LPPQPESTRVHERVAFAPDRRETHAVNLTETHASRGKNMGNGEAARNMLIGGIICVIGLLVTGFSFAEATGGSGRYIIAYGAIIFGGIQFLRGLTQSFGNR
jgi:hypothetical protein